MTPRTQVAPLGAGEASFYYPRAYATTAPRLVHAQNARLPRDSRVLLVGDSHVAWWTRPAFGWPLGARRLGVLDVGCFGVPGDSANNLRWRIERGEFDGCAPHTVVVALGANMMAEWSQPAVVADAIAAVAELLRCRVGARHVVLHGVLPRLTTVPVWEAARTEVNAQLEEFAGVRGWVYVDATPALTNARGTLDPVAFTEGIHLSSFGYARWANCLVTALAPLGDAPSRRRLVGVSPLFWRGLDVALRAKRMVRRDERRAA